LEIFFEAISSCRTRACTKSEEDEEVEEGAAVGVGIGRVDKAVRTAQETRV
jgi:hypothetical protein